MIKYTNNSEAKNMSHETNIPSEAGDLIDWLIGIQTVANEIINAERKVSHVREALAVLSLAPLIDEQFYIDCALIFAKSPNLPPDERSMFPRGMAFTGRLDGFHYLQDYDVPVDSLTINFGVPSVVDPDLDRCDEFKSQIFQVPIMAINSHLSLGKSA
jgi:hypothetical protein